MYSKLFFIVLLCASSSLASATIVPYDKKFVLRNTKALIEHPNIYSNARGNVDQRACNKTVKLSEEISGIDQELYTSLKCTYTVEAPPESQRIVVLSVWYEIASFKEIPDVPVESLYDPNLHFDIYDGTEKIESKRLYKLGDKSLDNAVTSGRYLTIDLNFERSDKYVAQSVRAKFAYL